MAVLQGIESGLGSILSAVKRNWRLSRGLLSSGLHFRNGILVRMPTTPTMENGQWKDGARRPAGRVFYKKE